MAEDVVDPVGPWCALLMADSNSGRVELVGDAVEFGDGATAARFEEDLRHVHLFASPAALAEHLGARVVFGWLERRDGAVDLAATALGPARPFCGPWRGRGGTAAHPCEVVRFVDGLTMYRTGGVLLLHDADDTFLVGPLRVHPPETLAALRAARDADVAWVDPLPTEAFTRGGNDCMADLAGTFADLAGTFARTGGFGARSAPRAPSDVPDGETAEWLRGYEAMARWTCGDDWRTCGMVSTPHRAGERGAP